MGAAGGGWLSAAGDGYLSCVRGCGYNSNGISVRGVLFQVIGLVWAVVEAAIRWLWGVGGDELVV